MTEALPDAAQRKALALQLERAMLAARRAARLSEDPGPLPALRILAYADVSSIDPDTLSGDWGPAWRRFADMVLISHDRQPKDPHGFASLAPLPAVDAYIDLAPDAVQLSWWSGRPAEERLYLAARTRPGGLSDADLAALGWWDEYHRRRLARGLPYRAGEDAGSELYRLLDAVVSGDVTVLRRLEERLPKGNAAVLRRLHAGAEKGDWPAEFDDDRGLWLLMLRLWAPEEVIGPARSAFHRWAAFRRAYDLTLNRSFGMAWSQIATFTAQSRPATRLQKEIENLRAYLTLVRSPSAAAMQQATTVLGGIRGYTVAKCNLELVRRQSQLTTNDRRPWENPYLVLGVDHGASPEVWKQAWRRTRTEKAHDIDQLSRVNEAKDMIMTLERDGTNGWGRVFILPLDGKTLRPYTEHVSRHLLPGPHPYPNRTCHLLGQAVEQLRSEAIRELLRRRSVGSTAPEGSR